MRECFKNDAMKVIDEFSYLNCHLNLGFRCSESYRSARIIDSDYDWWVFEFLKSDLD